MPPVSFSDATEMIEDGDIVFVHGSPFSVIQRLIMFLTGSTFSHCCIAFRVEIDNVQQLMCVEAQSHTTRRIIPLAFYRSHPLTIVTAPQPWEQVKGYALRGVGVAKYNILRAIYIGISEYVKRRFNKRLPAIERMDEICSEFCGDVYGLNISGSPQVLYEALMEITSEKEKGGTSPPLTLRFQ